MNRISLSLLILHTVASDVCLLQLRARRVLAETRHPAEDAGPTLIVKVPDGVGLRRVFAGVGDKVAIPDFTEKTEPRLLAESPAFADTVTNLGVSRDGRVAVVAAGAQLAMLDARELGRLRVLPVAVNSKADVIYNRINNGPVVGHRQIFFATMSDGHPGEVSSWRCLCLGRVRLPARLCRSLRARPWARLRPKRSGPKPPARFTRRRPRPSPFSASSLTGGRPSRSRRSSQPAHRPATALPSARVVHLLTSQPVLTACRWSTSERANMWAATGSTDGAAGSYWILLETQWLRQIQGCSALTSPARPPRCS
mmetsp:Transcript_27453/g.78506  ORF Transcript_27453/g.78506 Transcript_27453/m.78506 type:complete len:311 (+) Transcript_27453:49-981(+)